MVEAGAGASMVRAVLFDLGDTLFDYQTDDPRALLIEGIKLAYQRLVDQGVTLPPADKYLRRIVRAVEWAYFRSQVTLREVRLLDLIQRTHRKLGVNMDHAGAEQYARWCYEPTSRVFNATPGARETLERVRRAGYPIGLVSNTFMISNALGRGLAGGRGG